MTLRLFSVGRRSLSFGETKSMLSHKIKFKLARLFIRAGHHLGPWAQNLPAAFLSAEELIVLTWRYYDRPHVVAAWTQNVDCGLTAVERLFLKKYAAARPRVLVLGCGAGRESLIMARRGMRVTAVDRSEALITNMKRVASAEGLDIQSATQAIRSFMRRPGVFDLIFWGSNYGRLPTRAMRIWFLVQTRARLAPNGRVLCTYLLKAPAFWDRAGFLFHRALAFLTDGNHGVQAGDEIRGEGEYLHHFASTSEIAEEFEEAGYEVDAHIPKASAFFIKRRGDA